MIIDLNTGGIEDNNMLWLIQGVERFYPIRVSVVDNGFMFFKIRNNTFTKTWLISENIWSGEYLIAIHDCNTFLIVHNSHGNVLAEIVFGKWIYIKA